MSYDPRKLIAEGRQHDEAMTGGAWQPEPDMGEWSISIRSTRCHPDQEVDLAVVDDARPDDAAGIAWMRNNLRALLDGYAAALDEVERLRDPVFKSGLNALRLYTDELGTLRAMAASSDVWWRSLSDEHRRELSRRSCHGCGSLDLECQCWNDE